MRRLIESGLMFENLVPVDGPGLVENYNREPTSPTPEDRSVRAANAPRIA
jgi:hypothetical protein